jgi:hypothetical protein
VSWFIQTFWVVDISGLLTLLVFAALVAIIGDWLG